MVRGTRARRPDRRPTLRVGNPRASDGRRLPRGRTTGRVPYLERWGDSPVLDGWHEPGDVQLAGDFVGLGYDQVLFINRAAKGGRVLIADFKAGRPPAAVRYLERYGQSKLLDGWHEPADLQLVGDFRGLGYDQVLFINRAAKGGRVLIADFKAGRPPALAGYLEPWGASSALDGWHGPEDLRLSGDFADLGHQQVLFINRPSAP